MEGGVCKLLGEPGQGQGRGQAPRGRMSRVCPRNTRHPLAGSGTPGEVRAGEEAQRRPGESTARGAAVPCSRPGLFSESFGQSSPGSPGATLWSWMGARVQAGNLIRDSNKIRDAASLFWGHVGGCACEKWPGVF